MKRCYGKLLILISFVLVVRLSSMFCFLGRFALLTRYKWRVCSQYRTMREPVVQVHVVDGDLSSFKHLLPTSGRRHDGGPLHKRRS